MDKFSVIKYGIVISYVSKGSVIFYLTEHVNIQIVTCKKNRAGGIRQPYFYISFFPNFAAERRINDERKRTKDGSRK